MTLNIGLMLIFWALAFAAMCLGTWAALKKTWASRPPHLDAAFGLYPISILKPLKGFDPGLADNLKTYFELDYPQFEILFSVADARDPARRVVEKLIEQHPHIDAKLLIGGVDIGPNPKVNNLLRSYERAKYDWVLISDSNVRVSREELKRLAAHLESGVGLVTAVVAGRGAENWVGRLEAIYLNTFYARGMCLADLAAKPCVVGKCMLFSRKSAERFGGMRALARYLAEDYMAGVAMQRLGLKVVLACDPVHQHIGRYTLGDYWKRHVRWGRIRKSQAPLAFIAEILSSSVVSAALGGYAMSHLHVHLWHFLSIHFGVWMLCDLALDAAVGRDLHPASVGAWWLREFLALPLWLHTALGNSVLWRGRKLALQPGGLLVSTPMN